MHPPVPARPESYGCEMPASERDDAALMPAGRRWAANSAALIVAGVVVLCGLALTPGTSAARLAGGVLVFATVWVALNGFLFGGVPSPEGLAQGRPASSSPALSAIPGGYLARGIDLVVAKPGWRGKPTYYTFTRPA